MLTEVYEKGNIVGSTDLDEGWRKEMEYILNNRQMKEADGYTIEEIGIESLVLMERAALSLVEEMVKKERIMGRILALCGMGNNGGDGLAAARLLHLKGYDVAVECVGSPEKMTAETRRQYEIVRNYQIPVVNNPDYEEYTTIIDALFGIGLARPVEGICRQKIEAVNESGAHIWSVDIPSGVDGDTGRVMGVSVHADDTVTFAFAKVGHLLYPGREHTGHLWVRDIGIYPHPKEKAGYARCIGREDAGRLLSRDPGGHKGTFGRVLVLAGSLGMCGAAYLAGRAAYAAGAGMVKICAAEENRQILQTLLPEALYGSWDEETVRQGIEWCDAAVAGPGIGQGVEALHMFRCLLGSAREKDLPLVLDADGLNLLSGHRALKDMLYPRCVYTPHMMELGRMMGEDVRKLKEWPFDTIERAVRDYPGTLVWKDACTITRCAGGALYLNRSGNDGMATAGSGDVLAGLLGGLLASGTRSGADADLAVPLGVYLHGAAGDAAAEKKGRHAMTARDILEGIPTAMTGGKV